MSQGKYSGRLKGYSLITLKKKSTYGTGHYGVDPKNIQGGKKILSLKKKYVCYAPPVP
jgi:hypothetical protein